MARSKAEPTGLLKLPLRSAIALEMMLAGLFSLLVVELSRMSGPIGVVFGPIGVWFDWFATFFHELGHGLFVKFSSSTLRDFRLNWDGSGSVSYVVDSWRLPISWAGYAMPPAVGAFLYWEAHDRGLATQATLVVLALIVGGVTLWWPNETAPISTLTISAILVVSLLLMAVLCGTPFGKNLPLDWVQRIVAATLLIEGVRSIWYLLGYGEQSDAAQLAQMYFLPEWFWVLTWLAWTLALIYITYRAEVIDRRSKLKSRPRTRARKK